MAVSEEDREVAEAIAREVRALPVRRRTWRRVTTLLDWFGAYHLTQSVRERIAEALREAGLEVEPPIEEVERYGTVTLSLRRPPTSEPGDQERSPDEILSAARAMATATRWRPGQVPMEVPLEEASTADGVLWIDIDFERTDPEVLKPALAELLGPEIAPEMVDDLLSPDALPKVTTTGDVQDIRLVSAFSVDAEEVVRNPEDPDVSKAGDLVFQSVEFLVSSEWLVTCWQGGTSSTDGVQRPSVRGVETFDLTEHIVARWAGDESRVSAGFSSAGDLALLVLHELVISYGGARRTLYSWLESWEIDFFRRRERVETDTLLELRRLIAEFRTRLSALNRPGMRVQPTLIWFPFVSDPAEAERVDDLIDRSLRDLRVLSDSLLSAINLVSSVGSAAQTRQAERFQELAALIAAVLLVPTLVATIFGANTALPGGQRWIGFAFMVALMALTALLTYFLLRRGRRTWTWASASPGEPAATEEEAVVTGRFSPVSIIEPVIAVYDYVAADPHSRTPALLRILSDSERLTPEEIGLRLPPNDDGHPLTKNQARAVLRNLSRVEANLKRSGAVDREVLQKDFSGYQTEGSGRYGLSEHDKTVLRAHLQGGTETSETGSDGR